MAPTCVAIAKPLTLTAGFLPVANLHLAIGTEAGLRNLQASNRTVSVDTHTVAAIEVDYVVCIASAVTVVPRLERESNHAYTRIGIRPEARASAASLWVPLEKGGQGDEVARRNIDAGITGVDKLKLVAAVYHTRLRRQRRLDTIASCCWLCGGGGGNIANDRHTGPCVRPEARASGASIWVPCKEVGEADSIANDNICAVVVLVDKVELVTVESDTWLDWTGSSDTWKMNEDALISINISLL